MDAIEKNEAGEGRESLRGKGTQFRESGREDCVQKWRLSRAVVKKQVMQGPGAGEFQME